MTFMGMVKMEYCSCFSSRHDDATFEHAPRATIDRTLIESTLERNLYTLQRDN